MRRLVTLYIDGQKADLDEQSFLLMNYAATDFNNPAAVKNGYSHTVTLPGTENNNRIFGHAFRLDRTPSQSLVSHTGNNFVPGLRTDFTIYDAAGEVVESGYMKLNEVTRTGRGPAAYKVTLFSGLGSFLYDLSTTAEGEKRNLASLNFLKTENPAEELTFTINAATVQDAWTQLDGGNPSGKFGIINFAPAFNGYPEGFSCDRGIFTPSRAGLRDSIDTYSTAYSGGYALATLPRKYSEWEVKDLRSYLQRPVLNVIRTLRAICDPDNNGGWTVDLQGLDSAAFPWTDAEDATLWMTLPLLLSLGTYQKSTHSSTASIPTQSPATTDFTAGRIDIAYPEGAPVGVKVDVSLSLNLDYLVPGLNTPGASLVGYKSSIVPYERSRYDYFYSCAFVQLLAYSSDNVLMGSSPVSFIGQMGRDWGGSIAGAARACGFTPDYGGDDALTGGEIIGGATSPRLTKDSDGHYLTPSLSFNFSALDVAYVLVMVHPYEYNAFMEVYQQGQAYYGEGTPETMTSLRWNVYDTTMADSYDHPILATAATIRGSSATWYNISYTDPSSLRSGTTVTKRMLLSTSYTPADFLLSFCKTFGFHIMADAATKAVTIMGRNDYYNGDASVEDLTDRIDSGAGLTVEPCAIGARWYNFRHAPSGGQFEVEYSNIEGRDYGAQRVNTGYDFDAATVDVMQGVIFRGAASVLEKSPCFFWYDYGGLHYPAPFVESGAKYTLRDADGKTLDTDISALSAAIVAAAAPFNEYSRPGYFFEWDTLAQLHDADGKPVNDGSGVLLMLDAWKNGSDFRLSDDLPVMDLVNNGPCWLLDVEGSNEIRFPIFTRYAWSRWDVKTSLDFGVPSQLEIPFGNYSSSATIYGRRWGRYLADRLSFATKILRAKVDLRGLQVGPELFRRFYYYGGSLWVLNRIGNYSLTSWDLTDCEFVQVQDISNYTNGQF